MAGECLDDDGGRPIDGVNPPTGRPIPGPLDRGANSRQLLAERRLRIRANPPTSSPRAPTAMPTVVGGLAVLTSSLEAAFLTVAPEAESLLDPEAEEPSLPALVSLRVGSGYSGSGWPSTDGSFHRTTWPFE